MLKRAAAESSIELEFTIEISKDLEVWKIDERISRSVNMGGEKAFLRVRASQPHAQPDVKIYDHPAFGKILTTADDRVIYRFEFDRAGSGPGVVDPNWPNVPLAKKPQPDIGITATLGISDFGSTEGAFLTIEASPAYLHGGDSEPGQATAQGVGAVWWTVKPDGSLNKSTP